MLQFAIEDRLQAWNERWPVWRRAATPYAASGRCLEGDLVTHDLRAERDMLGTLLSRPIGRVRINPPCCGMAKYDPLCGHLRRQRQAELELTFTEIERILGAMLPKSAARPQWWANETGPGTTHVQRSAWRDAGYDAFLMVGKDRVRFSRSN